MSVYKGSIRDVGTLRTTISQTLPKHIDRPVMIVSETLHGMTKERSWMGGRRITIHVFYNEVGLPEQLPRIYEAMS